jgi:predicted metal-dependent peptidase
MNTARITQEQSDRLMNARCRLMTREPWYGHIAMSMIWIPSHNVDTMGVRIVNGGDIQCLYSPHFVDKLSIEELFAVIQHEIEHIVRVHCVRIGHRNPQAWNVVADMTVNGSKSNPRIGYDDPSTNKVILPLGGNIVWIPDGWPKDETSEFYYDKLEKQERRKQCPNCGKPIDGSGKAKGKGKSQSQQGNGSGEPCSTCGQEDNGEYNYGGVSGQSIDDHTTWNQSDVSEDEARQVIKDVVDQASEKAQGSIPGHLVEAIKNLSKPVIRWRELLRHYLGKHVGNQRKTYSRRNRRRDWFGVAGISHHAAADVCVIIDTSGSIGSRELEQFFAEIDAISSRAKVHVLQWDHAFQGYKKYRRGDWKKFDVHGRGGTDMAAPVQWLIDNRLVADVQVMLTDGYTGWFEGEKVVFPFITVITTPDTVGPDYGHIVRMKATE